MKTQQHKNTVGLFVAKSFVLGEEIAAEGSTHRAAFANFTKQVARLEASLPANLRRQAQ